MFEKCYALYAEHEVAEGEFSECRVEELLVRSVMFSRQWRILNGVARRELQLFESEVVFNGY